MTITNTVLKPKAGRGRSRRSIELIDAMYKIAKESEPITGRGVGYKLFSMNLIPSMSTNDMQLVYRLLKEAREEETIPWEWIVDESRSLEKSPSWDNPADYIKSVARWYTRDYWQQQPQNVEVWSEKGTIRGVLEPVLDEMGVGFRVMHGFGSATVIRDVAQADDSKPLTILYVGDYDPSGLYMSEEDIPTRLQNPAYGGYHITVQRIALLRSDCTLIGRKPAFNVKTKKGDPRAKWFQKNYGQLCWEVDAMDPNNLRQRLKDEIWDHIEDKEAWERCSAVELAEKESMKTFFKRWKPI
jgi:hypothetical protein